MWCTLGEYDRWWVKLDLLPVRCGPGPGLDKHEAGVIK